MVDESVSPNVDAFSGEYFDQKGLPGRVSNTMLTRNLSYDDTEFLNYVKGKLGPDSAIYECNNQPLGSGDLCDADYEYEYSEVQVSADIVKPGETPPA